jgi:hypothetical protein
MNKQTDRVKFAARIKNGFDGGVQEAWITKDGIEIKLDADDWKEVEATMRGERTRFDAELKQGDYIPETTLVWNHE